MRLNPLGYLFSPFKSTGFGAYPHSVLRRVRRADSTRYALPFPACARTTRQTSANIA